MQKWQDVLVTGSELLYIQCDCCGKKMEISDDFEIQEGLSWHNCGGYASIFGDGVEMSLDLCQHCVKKLLGKYIKYKED